MLINQFGVSNIPALAFLFSVFMVMISFLVWSFFSVVTTKGITKVTDNYLKGESFLVVNSFLSLIVFRNFQLYDE